VDECKPLAGGGRGGAGLGEHAVAAFHQAPGGGAGRLAVYGDSNCLDSSHMTVNCYPFLMVGLCMLKPVFASTESDVA
jgi:hypothetical protein